jgi:hypothetical protein
MEKKLDIKKAKKGEGKETIHKNLSNIIIVGGSLGNQSGERTQSK